MLFAGAGGADPEQCQKLRKRITDATTKVSRLRATASNKHAQVMEPIRTEVAQAILSRLSKIKEDQDPFALADVDGDGFVSRSEFQNFMNDCPGNFSRDQLKKLFDYLDDARVGRLERDEFMRAAIVFYRVSRPSVDLVQTMGVAQGKLVRKLDVNEILELLEGPIKEINKVVRVKCRAMKDGAIGWATATGSNGVVFVEQKRVHFQVKSSTTLTDVLSAKACTTIRELKDGELLEVFVWEKVDPTTGLRRLKGRALKDGSVGWATVGYNRRERRHGSFDHGVAGYSRCSARKWAHAWDSDHTAMVEKRSEKTAGLCTVGTCTGQLGHYGPQCSHYSFSLYMYLHVLHAISSVS